MARILITSGPTRQYLDPVRYLTNASSGRMGRALAAAAIEAGHQVVVVSGPVAVRYPPAAEVVPVVSTEEMLEACLEGLSGLRRADCRRRPLRLPAADGGEQEDPQDGPAAAKSNWSKRPTSWPAWERSAGPQWMVAFALETEDRRLRALQKLEQKNCDLIVVNGPAAIGASRTRVQVLGADGAVLADLQGSKRRVAAGILEIIQQRLMG